ncbi:MAG TPA: PVC-type heme-binding CxxCH protein [Planctomycetota bacterium]|nr:PVC-type heme-binding CxxCH protein [Planctomycetota bacterium]
MFLRLASTFFLIATISLAGEYVPYHQIGMPGPPLSPDEGVAKMTLPEGFKIECVAAEPDVINPTAFTFDERGRIWVCESIEYPRASAGPGKDHIKILEFSEKDNKYHNAGIVKDGLNIPCGIVMGNGGFYYTNSPDIVYAHLDANGKVDKEEVILTGFGRDDRHELPNSLTWGPDGWLYGLNGVFNNTTVKNNGKTFKFTCAIWRWHPKTKIFELFAEGTSNPWGLDYNAQGDWFVTCCVIKHLFHMTQSGYYHRQGGPYPPFTHKIDEKLVATEEHFMAANGGLCIYQGDAYPPEYQGAFFMGNLHGSQVNRDVLTRNGSTYKQKNAPDFIDAHDKWFMPVAQKVGPDGCIYVMDWYDKYHCYQDSGRPDLDRERGRIYRISYKDKPRVSAGNLTKVENGILLVMLTDPNQWQRREAQRILNERINDPEHKLFPAELNVPETAVMIPSLQRMALSTDDPTQRYIHSLWLLCSQNSMEEKFHLKLLNHADPVRRSWGVRMIGQMGKVSQPIYDKLIAMANDPSPDVRVQVPVAAGRLTAQDSVPVLLAMMKNAENAADPIIPNIIYNNFKPLAKTRGEELMRLLSDNEPQLAAFKTTVIPWLRECIAGGGEIEPSKFVDALKKSLRNAGNDAANEKSALVTCIDAFNAAGMKFSERAKLIEKNYRPTITALIEKPGKQQTAATAVALWWNDAKAVEFARAKIADAVADEADRVTLVKALGDLKDASNLSAIVALFNDAAAPIAVRKAAADAIGAIGGASAAQALLANFKTLPADLKPACINNLSGSAAAAKALLDALESKQLAPTDINSNNARAIAQLGDAELTKRLTALWGRVKSDTERDPKRVEVVNKMRKVVTAHKPGDALKGWKVFEKNCQQCHAIYGKGNDVGPNLTGVGRDNLDLILSNVLDPSFVVGKGFNQHLVRTKEGKVITGLLVEDTPKTMSLKIAGGTIEKISKDEIAAHKESDLSLMPDELEKAMTEDEFCDLVAFLLTKQEPKP